MATVNNFANYLRHYPSKRLRFWQIIHPHSKIAMEQRVVFSTRSELVQRREKPSAAPGVTRIALTGGPCSGKSSALGFLKERLSNEGYTVYCVPETATLLAQAGIVFEPGDRHKEFTYQVSLARLQLAAERSFTAIAASRSEEQPSVLIEDRGILDNKGYMDDEMWQSVLDNLNSTHTDLGDVQGGVSEAYLLGRYDGIVHMVTAADGAVEFYKYGTTTDDNGNLVVRRETPSQAIALDQQMWDVWNRHPNHVRVTNEGTFEEKLESTADAILKMLRSKNFLPVRNVLGSDPSQHDLRTKQ